MHALFVWIETVFGKRPDPTPTPTNPNQEFADWSSAVPPPKSPPADFLGELPPFPGPGAGPANATEIKPALVIGIGAAGAAVLSQWVDHSPSFLQKRPKTVRCRWIGDSGDEPVVKTDPDVVHVCRLAQDSAKAGPRWGKRHEFKVRFLEDIKTMEAIRRDVRRHLMDDVQPGTELRIIVVASVSEAASGILGGLLHLLKAVGAGPGTLTTCVILTRQKVDDVGSLDEGEVFAALREAARFTVQGEHKFPLLPGELNTDNGIVRDALVNHLFVVDVSGAEEEIDALAEATFANGPSQAICGALSVLLDPGMGAVWQDLKNNTGHAAEICEREAAPVVHSFGIASVYAPVREMREYIAARLSRAVLYGENPDRPAEGLISTAPVSAQETGVSAENLARRWLINDDVCNHPLFEWVSKPASEGAFAGLPFLDPEKRNRCEAAFQAKLAHGVTSFLNDPMEKYDQLDKAVEAVRWLDKRLKRVTNRLAETVKPELHDRATFLQEVMDLWRGTTRDLLKQLQEWEEKVSPGKMGGSAKGMFTNAPSPSQQNMHTKLEELRRSKEKLLEGTAAGCFRKKLNGATAGGEHIGKEWYESQVRPELSQFEYGAGSNSFKQVRKRLCWWADLRPGAHPKLFLCCLPPNLPGNGKNTPPPKKAVFNVGTINKLTEVLLENGRVQARALGDELEAWVSKEAEGEKEFLHRASHSLLAFKALLTPKPRALGYVAAAKQGVAQELKELVFPDPLGSVQALSTQDRSRVTGFHLFLNILLEALPPPQIPLQYLNVSNYIYEQERAATKYEKLPASNQDESPLLAPKLILALADQELVRLFCGGLLSGAIDKASRDGDSWWQIETFSNEPAHWLRKDDTQDGLWDAFLFFTLTWPCHKKIAQQQGTNPFHHAKRDEFLKGLEEHVKKRLVDTGKSPELQDHLGPLRKRAKAGDRFTRGFLQVLDHEIKEWL